MPISPDAVGFRPPRCPSCDAAWNKPITRDSPGVGVCAACGRCVWLRAVVASHRPVLDLGLKCAGCGYSLTGLTEFTCPECGVEFDLGERLDSERILLLNAEALISGLARRPFSVWIDVRGFFPYSDMNVILRPLRERNVPFIQSTGTEPGASVETPACVLVPFEFLHELVDASRDHHGNWTCSACREGVPDSFDICWNCGAVRGAPD